MNTERPVPHPAAILCSCALALSGLIGLVEASRRPTPLTVDDGVLVNTRAQYYFVVPDGWALDDKSDYRDVVLLHSASSSSFRVAFKRAPDFDIRTEYRYLTNALTLSGARSVRGGGEGLAIDGRPAMSITYTMTSARHSPDQISRWLVRDGEVAFEISASIPEPVLAARTPDIGQIMNSFKWGKRDNQP